ncbi:hypothetical protein L227DRAFT_603052 [Lentinus tigrinus ALCF2SS1-6]|uniref:F-box domain-containing protein n=1 Tax=Lentinus tigrinus ALCF2SS1-6 TaxID=1328759 RepID=A0A5C2RZF4_9APHY|nr:hypothetical protein L227DRAFT_603052 [Lentinus tigrinus ALCF2SS1-6]
MASEPALRFNNDILCEITNWADRRTCASLMLTCKVLNKAGAKSVLQSSGGICIWGEKDTVLFHRFLHADPSRFQHVRELHIFVASSMSQEALDGLLDDLRRMERLKTIGLTNADATLANFPALADALAKLTTIQRLDICTGGSDAVFTFLSQMRSDLVSIRLEWTAFEDAAERRLTTRWADYHPVPLLSKWTASLEELTCESWLSCRTVLPQFTQVYPNFRRLSLVGDGWTLIAPFIRPYPNLAQLAIKTDPNEHLWDRRSDNVEFLQAQRALNKRSQKDGAGGKTVTWSHLEELVGSVFDLYGLGLICRVQRVHIDDVVYPKHLKFLLSVLAYAQPKHLKAECSGSLLVHPLASQGFMKLLRSSCIARLESLVLKFSLSDGHPDEGKNISSALSDLANSLKRLPLRRLRLRIDIPTFRCASLRHYPALITAFEKFDLEAYVRNLADAVPALEDAVVCVKGGRDHDANGCPTRTAEAVRVHRRGAEYADREMYEWSS